MKIERIRIEHFRSIKQLDFQPGAYCVLIGENNSGKSNILRAVNLALGDTWPSDRAFSEEDFHDQDTTSDIVIQVFFDEVVRDWRGGYEVSIGGVELRCKAYKRTVKGKPPGTLKVDYVCINAKGAPVQYPADGLRKGEQYKGKWLPLRVSNDIRDRLPFIYVDVLRDYRTQMPGSRWSILRRLFNEVNAEFLSDKTQIHVPQSDGTQMKMTRREAFETAVKGAYQFLRTAAFEEIEKKLAANAMEQMGLDEGANKVELSFESHDPTNAFKSLQLYVDQMGIRSPAGEVGAGLQSAIVVAIFRTYEELRKEGAVFAIEEPEVFLHPQKARYFATVLRTLAEKGNQVLLTTHSPVFVQVHDPKSIAIVRRTSQTGTTIHRAEGMVLAETERTTLRLLTEFDSQRNEMFFARRVMFVEGNTERFALPLACRAMGIDINKENVSVIECGGKTQIPLFARAASKLGIPFVVLVDRDIHQVQAQWSDQKKRKATEDNEIQTRRNQAIEREAGQERTYFLDPDFEGALGSSSGAAQKVDQALKYFANAKAEDVPECIRKPILALMDLR